MQINSKLKSRSCVQIVSSVWICLSYPILINDIRRGSKEAGLDVSEFGDLEEGRKPGVFWAGESCLFMFVLLKLPS